MRRKSFKVELIHKKVKQNKGQKKQWFKKKQHCRLTAMVTNIPLSVSGLNKSVKRHRFSDWTEKHDPNIYCSAINILKHLKYKNTS